MLSFHPMVGECSVELCVIMYSMSGLFPFLISVNAKIYNGNRNEAQVAKVIEIEIIK